MHVTLVHPPQFVAAGNQVSTIAMPPLGLAYLAGTLREAGHEVAVVDGFGEGLGRRTPFGSVFLWGLPYEEIIRRIPKDTGVIGVGCMFSSNWLSTRLLLNRIRGAFRDVPVILGGEHATGLPEMCFAQSPIDLLVQGEGEEILLGLVGSLASGESVAPLQGIGYRRGSGRVNTAPANSHAPAGTPLLEGQVVLNARGSRIRKVDDIPWPAWDLLDLESYIHANSPHGVSRGRFIPMLATRGCPFQCTFCTNPEMWTQLWIPRSPQKVVDEMEHYVRAYRVTDIQFEDLTAIVRREWIVEFCREILKRNLKISFQLPSGTRSEAMDEEVAILMKRAGCHEFAFAPESGDEETLKIIKKQVSLPRMFAAARGAMRAGISVSCFFIVGFPHERIKHILKTYAAILRCAVLGIKAISVNVFSPQPSTRLFKELQLQNRITLDDRYLWSLFEFPAVGRKKRSFNERFSDAQITAISIGGLILFYGTRYLLRPHLLPRLFWEMFGGTRDSDNRLGKYLRSMRKEFIRERKAPLDERSGEQDPGGEGSPASQEERDVEAVV